jgi:hypothetical protein
MMINLLMLTYHVFIEFLLSFIKFGLAVGSWEKRGLI